MKPGVRSTLVGRQSTVCYFVAILSTFSANLKLLEFLIFSFCPAFNPLENGIVKVSTASLMDGLCLDNRYGNHSYGLSTNHTLGLRNRSAAWPCNWSRTWPPLHFFSPRASVDVLFQSDSMVYRSGNKKAAFYPPPN
ncbi:MAG: hypothetical protein CMJ81_14870 [Planctomycetaceae bacterium]|nr:hypothetical protein [Planctomycetaceae bacterium]MBP63887.1 hypothetical protein [Planctomycetaceae bacterium]